MNQFGPPAATIDLELCGALVYQLGRGRLEELARQTARTMNPAAPARFGVGKGRIRMGAHGLARIGLGTALVLLVLRSPASAQQSYLQPPAQMDAAGRCVYFSRLVRFTAESKSVCDEGRKVKTGPVTAHILDQCLADRGHGFDTTAIDDMTEAFARQVREQGLGNACNQVKAQAWDLVAQ